MTYPTEEALEQIRTWEGSLPDLFAFIKTLWWAPDWGWHEPEPFIYHLATGGWSGNEDLIEALKGNYLAWALTWESSRKGGHYAFSIPGHLLKLKDYPKPERTYPAWRPIETAPKDGTPILGLDSSNGEMTTVWWYQGSSTSWWCLSVPGQQAEDTQWEPDFWMPLPDMSEIEG